MGSVGDSYDNALAETINGFYKAEVIQRRGPRRSFEAVEFATLEWVDWFNNRRLLEPIDNISPAEAEQRYYASLDDQTMAAWLISTGLPQSPGRFRRTKQDHMAVTSKLRDKLYNPELRDLGVDEAAALEIHRKSLQQKPMLQSAFKAFYEDLAVSCDKYLSVDGIELELGSGAGFFKQTRPCVITSDVRKADYIDRIIDAQDMDLEDNSVRCIYAINVFHHLPDPAKFLSELVRVIKPGGGCILIEPHNGFGSRLLHKHLHKDEIFDVKAPSWTSQSINGPMSGANQALSYIVFERDKELFEQLFGQHLELVARHYSLNSLRYLVSGGLNFQQLLPSWTEPLLRGLEQLGSPLARHWAFHQVIVLKRI